jgi:transcriptional regulator with XRE-family HTH domain
MSKEKPLPPIARMMQFHRAHTGQDQAKLAAEIGIQPMTVSRLEAGKNVDRPTVTLLTAWLFGRSS